MNLKKLKELRQAKGLTQSEMAKLLGYKDKSGYCQLENGNVKITLEKALKISEILETNIEEIFFENNVENNSTKRQSA